MTHNLDDGADEILSVRRPVQRKLQPTASLPERQFELIVEGLQIEYAGRANALINVCSDSRFASAKNELYAAIGHVRAHDLLDKIFCQ